jgi:peptidylprolyl isomerase
MRYFPLSFLATVCLSFGALQAEEPASVQKNSGVQKKEIAKISEALGHLVGKNIDSMGVELDVQAIVKGLKDSFSGKNPPMSEVECLEALSKVQEAAFEKTAAKNLSLAEDFLTKNGKSEGIVSCEEGKVQYKIDQEGAGEGLKNGDRPLVHYTLKLLDGSVFTQSKEPEPLPLDEIIPGLRAGLLGMKEGEKRTIFIHPQLAYNTSGSLPPNSLMTFEMELLKANTPIVEPDAPTTEQGHAEIALPEKPIENVR